MLATEVQPLVGDDLLAELASPDYHQQCGEFDAETRAMLAVALPEICSELLRWRQTAANRPFALALALRSAAIEARLTDARRAIRAPDPIHPRALTAACETLLRHSADAAERAAASDALAQMQEAA
ncbi:hypothetical protein R1T40_08470 [Tritonibacter scottomollicae]|uniref:Uncharacterized protein n=1 Tax=Tritonibacter scottomollicae TaxID=483013 RepID=A0ABZ0HKS3_TRISK|nr:hypothetical protein [Tritonibacter scottomollicae]WOI34744.1 hypothetical protein R1T40_08470 [Tritonibacter scottomollicae]